MNLVKNMEAVFIVTLALAGSASYLADSAARATPPAPIAVGGTVSTTGKMAVVVVRGKRMSAAEKQQSLDEEKFASIRAASRRRI